ncbi:MAG: Gfo/Idh/MocA family oxidoreductase [Chloroflexi bacterium]|nr:Gfo/Idh/MocA family oxidoreductase [Chloroflexota bacterium]
MANKVKIGIIGCGNISPVYFKATQRMEVLELVGCADMVFERAHARAEEYGTQAFTVDEMLAHPDVQIIINLTIPAAHGEIGLRAVRAGKSVYNEKPLAATREQARELLDEATKRGVLVGGAPDTFLGAGLQTCRKLIDDGIIGKPIHANAWFIGGGPEPWHPDPEFFYAPGGGPMFDMGPYYVTALVTLLGAAKRVSGATAAAYAERTIGSGAKKGNKITVQIPTHVTGVIDFEGGAVGTLVASFDAGAGDLGITIYGTEGTMFVPDPNTFGGPVKVKRKSFKDFAEANLTHSYADQSRGLGVADMAYALQSGRAHRASGALAYHVLDVMHAIHDASRDGRHITMTSGIARPAPLPTGLRDGLLDE